jgi:hypothetical protein
LRKQGHEADDQRHTTKQKKTKTTKQRNKHPTNQKPFLVKYATPALCAHPSL